MGNEHKADTNFHLPYWVICIFIALTTVILVVVFAVFDNVIFRSLLVLFVVVFLVALLFNPERRFGRIGSALTATLISWTLMPSFPVVVPCESRLGGAIQWVMKCDPKTGFQFVFADPPAVAYLVVSGLAALTFVLDYKTRERFVSYGDAERTQRLKTEPQTEIVTITTKTVKLRERSDDDAK